ncbi:hypothetical protein ACOMHN_053939 [Nucella lapillus]
MLGCRPTGLKVSDLLQLKTPALHHRGDSTDPNSHRLREFSNQPPSSKRRHCTIVATPLIPTVTGYGSSAISHQGIQTQRLPLTMKTSKSEPGGPWNRYFLNMLDRRPREIDDLEDGPCPEIVNREIEERISQLLSEESNGAAAVDLKEKQEEEKQGEVVEEKRTQMVTRTVILFLKKNVKNRLMQVFGTISSLKRFRT